MATFYDDFERANGALGGSWGSATQFAIVGGYAGSNQTTWSLNWYTGISDTGKQIATASMGYLHANGLNTGPVVKNDGTALTGYLAKLELDSGTYYLRIEKMSDHSLVGSRTSIGTTQPFTWTITLEYDQGNLTATYNGSVTATGYDLTYAGNQYAAIAGYSTTGRMAWCRLTMGNAPSLTITPSVVGNYGSAVTLTADGANTAWTSGTPGSPAFECDHGTITAQTVSDADSAELTYDPGTFLGTVTFTDPSTGATDTIMVTSDTEVIPPTGSFLSQTAIDYIERSAVAEDEPTIANREMAISDAGAELTLENAIGRIRLSVMDRTYAPDGNQQTLNLIDDLYARLWGGEEWQSASFAEPGTNAVATTLLALATSWAAFRDPPTYTIQDMMDNLRGTGNYNHTDLYNAIPAAFDDTAILDAIAGVKGDPLATVKAVLDALFVLGGDTNNYTLNTVKTWVEAVRGTGLPTIKTVMDKLGPGGTSLEVQINALSDLIVTEGTLQGMLDILLTAITGGVGVTLTSISSDIIDAINNIPPPTAVSTPLWPGLAGVTLGDSVAISDGLVVTGPLHGLLFTITGYPPGAGKYVFGDVNSWQHTGGVIFVSDNTYYERAESFGLEKQILVPRTMEIAASAILRVNSGWTGTVRPWTRTA